MIFYFEENITEMLENYLNFNSDDGDEEPELIDKVTRSILFKIPTDCSESLQKRINNVPELQDLMSLIYHRNQILINKNNENEWPVVYHVSSDHAGIQSMQYNTMKPSFEMRSSIHKWNFFDHTEGVCVKKICHTRILLFFSDCMK